MVVAFVSALINTVSLLAALPQTATNGTISVDFPSNLGSWY